MASVSFGSQAFAQTQASPSVSPASQPQAQSAAPSSVGEVVVTARRRSESLQNVPVAVTVISPKIVNRVGNFSPENLVQMVPSMGLETDLTGGPTFSIRGQSKVFGGLFPSVVPYFAEVPLDNLSEGEFFDMQNIEVLRGPQGTLFGRVTDGGNIMLTPTKPANDFEGYAQAKGGDYGLYGFSGAVNIPIVDDEVLLRVSTDIERRDGYVLNVNTGKELQNVNFDSFRVGIVLRPAQNIENYTIFNYSEANENGQGFEIFDVNQAVVAKNLSAFVGPAGAQALAAAMAQQVAIQRARGVYETALGNPAYGAGNWGIGDQRHDIYLVNTTTWAPLGNLTVKNIFGYIYTKDPYSTGVSGTSFTPAPGLGTYIDTYGEKVPENTFYNEQYSEELQAQGHIGDRFNYTLGTYQEWQRTPGPSEGGFDSEFFVQVGLVQDTQTRSSAYYASGTYDLSDWVQGLKVDAGLRYSEDAIHSQNAEYLSFGALDLAALPRSGQCLTATELAVSFATATASPGCEHLAGSWHDLTYEAGVDYQLNSLTLLYAKVSTGYRPGGFNATAGPEGFQYNPEYDLSVEIGAKADYTILGVKARTDLSAYHDNYTNIQKATINFVNNLSVSAVTNAADAIVQGVELEQTIIPFKGLTVGMKWALTDAHFINNVSPTALALACPANPSTTGNVGWCPYNRFSGTPQNTVSLDVNYILPFDALIGKASVGASYYHRSTMATSDTSYITPDAVLPILDLLDLNATWTNIFHGPIDLSFFMTNALDKKYMTYVAAYENASSVGTSAGTYGEPRMFGFTLKYYFGPSR
jgi:iron complex outermembrane receptor protein